MAIGFYGFRISLLVEIIIKLYHGPWYFFICSYSIYCGPYWIWELLSLSMPPIIIIFLGFKKKYPTVFIAPFFITIHVIKHSGAPSRLEDRLLSDGYY